MRSRPRLEVLGVHAIEREIGEDVAVVQKEGSVPPEAGRGPEQTAPRLEEGVALVGEYHFDPEVPLLGHELADLRRRGGAG
jgi:hypothetical protein